MRNKKPYSTPWKAVGDTVYDACGNIVKAPHHCSWEGGGYWDDKVAAKMIETAINAYYEENDKKGGKKK